MRNFILILLLASLALTVKAQSTTCPNGFTCGSKFVDPRDGTSYPTLQIGTQCWMTVNLRATKYLNGDSIHHITNGTTWANMTTGAWCDYNNATNNGRTYGHLYNWYAVSDGRSLCPLGWYVPTNNEWSILVNFVESAFPLCKICTGTIVLESAELWTGGSGGNNASGFSALPAGYRHGSTFYMLGSGAVFWSSSKYNLTTGWYMDLPAAEYNGFVIIGYGLNDMTDGQSVRCVKDN